MGLFYRRQMHGLGGNHIKFRWLLGTLLAEWCCWAPHTARQEDLRQTAVDTEVTQPFSRQSAFNRTTRLAPAIFQIENCFGPYGGTSPQQWVAGRQHPVF